MGSGPIFLYVWRGGLGPRPIRLNLEPGPSLELSPARPVGPPAGPCPYRRCSARPCNAILGPDSLSCRRNRCQSADTRYPPGGDVSRFGRHSIRVARSPVPRWNSSDGVVSRMAGANTLAHQPRPLTGQADPTRRGPWHPATTFKMGLGDRPVIVLGWGGGPMRPDGSCG